MGCDLRIYDDLKIFIHVYIHKGRRYLAIGAFLFEKKKKQLIFLKSRISERSKGDSALCGYAKGKYLDVIIFK